MRPLPDLTNAEAMAARGRRGALISARNEAAEELRNASVSVQSADFAELAEHAPRLRAIAQRLEELSQLWEG